MQAGFFRDAIDVFGQREGVDTMKKLKEREGVSNLVLLQVSDKVPSQSRGQLGDLGSRFLDAAFTEKILARLESFPHAFGGMSFRNRD